MQKQKVGLFVGRFQPGLHLGEIDALQQAIDQGVTDFLIAIGSSNKKFTKENPFTYDERKIMVELSLKEYPGIRYQIFSWPDVDSDEDWKNYAFAHFPSFDCVITGNPRVREIWQKTDKSVIWVDIRIPVKSTFLRDKLLIGDFDGLGKYLTSTVVEYLRVIKADERVKAICAL